ncbi:MAG TPA: O-antigen ligase family protein, partial [Solirubrobacteraceae bacterium]|nr:O-antigen ligase family protein [Solirubrobacteraceae bacterium]
MGATATRLRLPRPRLARAAPESGWTGVALLVGVAVVLCATAVFGAGGIRLRDTTPVELGLTVLGIGLAALAALRGSGPVRLYGSLTLLTLAALAALTAISIAWSVEPSDSWTEANRTLAYLATFTGGMAVARLAPGRWNAFLGGLLLGGATICAYAVATKVFPGSLDPDAIVSRLRAPFEYWNAIGVVAAMTVPLALWLGARRSGHGAVNALAYPALGLALITILMAYSRGALLAAGLGALGWFAFVPLRLRGVVVLATSSAGAALVVLWALSQDGLTAERLPIGLRSEAGTELGVLLVGMGLVLAAVGAGLSFWMARRAIGARARRRLGVAVAILVALALVGGGTAVALASGGLSGTWSSLTDPNAAVPDNGPDRLTSAGSVRARYWRDALEIFGADPVAGSGAGAYATVRLRYREDRALVRHAHGYAVQTLADLGLLGLLLSLAAAVAWLLAAARTTALRPRRWDFWRRDLPTPPGPPWTAERVAMVTLAAVVVTFGVHSLVDWTWFVPGSAVFALLAAGWVAARGPLDGELSDPVEDVDSARGGVTVG